MNKDSGFCDLHIHSDFSDSDTDIESIFRQAASKNLKAISITDHDTLAGIPLAFSLAERFEIELIPGIEFSAQYLDSEIHMLGYFMDHNDKRLIEELSSIKHLRRQRIVAMSGKLTQMGIAIDPDELFLKIGSTIPTRLHLALHLIEKGCVGSLREAFSRYLSPGKPAYISRFRHSVKDAVNILKGAGGLAFLAHPHMIPDQEWINEFISMGIDGFETVYPGMSCARRSVYEGIAKKHNLLLCGGSDAHGSYKEFTQVGGVDVPFQWVEAMKSRLAGAESQQK